MGCVLCKTCVGGREDRRGRQNGGARRTSGCDTAELQKGAGERDEESMKRDEIEDAPAAEDVSNGTVPVASPEFYLWAGVASPEDRWPSWLVEVAGNAIKDWKPRRANTFEKLDKIGQGTYSNVYKARDLITGKVVALKKVRFDTLEPETVRFMSREILILRRLNHPNVIKLEGLVISRMSCSLYLVFEYMEHDLSGISAFHSVKFTEPQVKCYMKQLLSGLEHCHDNGVLHRDIKCSNLLIDDEGILKIADFGLASFFDPQSKQPMTSRVVTLWYRPPELLLGATSYGTGVDLWSAGCVLAELLAGKAILRGRTEVEQLHKIFRLCGSPSEQYWKKSRLTNAAAVYKPQQPYKPCIRETFKDFPPSSFALLENLLSVDSGARGTAAAALHSEFFSTEPLACETSSLPKFPPSKEMDIKLRDEEARRKQGLVGKPRAADGNRRTRLRAKVNRAMPAPEANAELHSNIERMRIMPEINTKSKSEKFPPPHQDGAVGRPHTCPLSFSAADASFSSSIFDQKPSRFLRNIGPRNAASRRKNQKHDSRRVPSRRSISSSINWSMDFLFSRRQSETERNAVL